MLRGAVTKQLLASLLVDNPIRGATTLLWWRRAASTNSPKASLGNIQKLGFLIVVQFEKKK